MPKIVDSYKFINGITKRMVRTWIKIETPRDIPWTPLRKPISECTVALISSGGIALKTDTPFDQEGEHLNPWWGDPIHRVIPRGTKTEEIKLYHLHVDPCCVETDINSLLPIDRLDELEAVGMIGKTAPSHYSFMGYNMQPKILLKETTPKIIRTTLNALQSIIEPGGVVHLPFEWLGDPKEIEHNMEPPPIANYLMKHPFQVRNLLKRQVPDKFLVEVQ